MKTIAMSKPMYIHTCQECGGKFGSNERKARVCQQCQEDSSRERARYWNSAKSNSLREQRPFRGFLRILDCTKTKDDGAIGDDLVIGGDLPEASLRDSVAQGYFSTSLKAVDYTGAVWVVKANGKQFSLVQE